MGLSFDYVVRIVERRYKLSDKLVPDKLGRHGHVTIGAGRDFPQFPTVQIQSETDKSITTPISINLYMPLAHANTRHKSNNTTLKLHRLRNKNDTEQQISHTKETICTIISTLSSITTQLDQNGCPEQRQPAPRYLVHPM